MTPARKYLSLSLLLLLWTVPSNGKELFQEIVVKPGDTMWSIANKYLKDPKRWPDIVKYNKSLSADPTMALPGTKIRVPVILIKEKFRTAQLIKAIPDVRYKRKGSAKWISADENMTLQYEDSLRTMKGALARVQFPTKEIVQINENSYVVLKPEKILQEVELLQGDIRASRAKVIMPQGTVVIPRDGDSDYHARVRKDKTEVVFVYKGKVDVTAQGKTVTVPEGYGTEVPKSSIPLTPMPLSKFKDFDPKELTTTAWSPRATVIKKGLVKIEAPKIKDPVRIKRDSSKSRSVVSDKIMSHYKIQLAPDEEFALILLKKTYPTGTIFNIDKEKIPDGTYHMRIAFLDALGVQGPYSQPSIVIKDTNAPVIKNVVPADGQKFYGEESYCDVIGTVGGATMLAVNGKVIFISDKGRFNKTIFLSEGPNRIKVLARDAQGNESVVHRTVYYTQKRGRGR